MVVGIYRVLDNYEGYDLYLSSKILFGLNYFND